MIPSTNTILTSDIEVVTQPDLTYRMYIGQERIQGTCEGLEAIRQAIYKILNTERYDHVIYSWNYGIRLIDLYGEPMTYVIPELERRIQNALSIDDRVLSCDNFEFDTSQRNSVLVKFTAHTIYGDTNIERSFNI